MTLQYYFLDSGIALGGDVTLNFLGGWVGFFGVCGFKIIFSCVTYSFTHSHNF